MKHILFLAFFGFLFSLGAAKILEINEYWFVACMIAFIEIVYLAANGMQKLIETN